MSEIEQYLKGRRSIVQRELVDLEAKVKSMIIEDNSLKESIEYQQQLRENHKET